MPRFNVNAPDGTVIPVDAPAGATEQDAIAFAAATYKPSTGIPGPRAEKQGFLSKLGAGTAALADTTIGGVLPMLGSVVQAGARPFTSPQQAEQMGGAVSSALEKPFGKAFGVTENPAYKNEASQRLMGFISANVNKGADWIAQQTGMPVEDVRNMIGTATLAVPKVAAAVAPVVKAGAVEAATAARQSPLGQAIEAPIQARNARIGQERTAESYQNAGRIDAATQGSKIGLVGNPAEMNPTASNRLKAFATDPKVINETAAKANAVQVPKIALNEMGLPPNTALNADTPFIAAREAASGPYKEIAKLPTMTASPEVVKSIEALRPSKLLLGEERAAILNNTIDSSIQELSNGLTGAETVKSISDLRAQAQNLNNAQKAGHPIPATDVDKIKAYRGVADALEQMVEDNVSDPKLLSDLRAARVKIAKIHAYEDATDFNTGKIDPSELAKLTAKNPRLTGDISTIGRFAGNFPEAMGLTTPETMAAVAGRKLTRTSLSGAMGAAIGTAVGAPIAGLAAGAAAGELGSSLMAKRMVSPSYQASKAIPQDFRQPVVNNLQPGTSNVTVFDPRNALAEPAPPPISQPNWVYAQQQPEVRTGVQPMGAPRLAAPSGEATMRTVAEQRKFDYNMQKALEEKAAQEQAAREAAGRQVTKGGVVIGEQPAAGTTLMPTSLESAIQKLTGQVVPETSTSYKTTLVTPKSGAKPYYKITPKEGETTFERGVSKAFDLTATEKIAWDKTKANLNLIDQAPGFKALTDKAIAQKMMDREWVAEAYAKARQKAAMFDDIAKRAANEQTKFDANVKRDQMLDLLTTLEDNLRNARPTSAGGQGPKTREAIRNKLLGGDNQNNLR